MEGLPVATMDFKVSLPIPDHQALLSPTEPGFPLRLPTIWPKTLIEITGKTRGSLRLFEEYHATVKYVQLDANGKNAMTSLVSTTVNLNKREFSLRQT